MFLIYFTSVSQITQYGTLQDVNSHSMGFKKIHNQIRLEIFELKLNRVLTTSLLRAFKMLARTGNSQRKIEYAAFFRLSQLNYPLLMPG